jgi:DNA-binding transcriptional regulator YiaG
MTSGSAPQPINAVHRQFLGGHRPIRRPLNRKAAGVRHSITAPIRKGSAGNTNTADEGIKPTSSFDCTGQGIGHGATMQDFFMACQPSSSWHTGGTRSRITAMPATHHKVFVGNNLRLAIEALGLSQAEFARRTQISPNKLHNYLRGANYPEPYWLTKVCDDFGLTVDWFYRGIRAGVAAGVAANLRATGPA